MKKKLTALILALALSLGLCAPALAAEFTEDHYAHDAIQSAAAKGIASGYADGTFKYNNPVTYGQFAVMLARAFFPEELAENEAQGKAEGKPWYWAAITILGTKVTAHTPIASANDWLRQADKPITRQYMAYAIYALLLWRGIKSFGEEYEAAKERITDCYSYQVIAICAYGIITGYPDGTFRPMNTMNRAQACVVIDRTAKYLGENAIPEVTFPANVTDPKNTSIAKGRGYMNQLGWTIVNNGYPAGTLNNGKPITEENVLELLASAKQNWHTGMRWSGGEWEGMVPNCYNPGNISIGYNPVVSNMNVMAFGRYSGASAFAAMISDYVFGPNDNPGRQISSGNVHAGDMLFNGRRGAPKTQVMIVLSSETQTIDGVRYVPVCDANRYVDGHINGIVLWDEPGTVSVGRIDSYTDADGVTWDPVIYSRYPA